MKAGEYISLEVLPAYEYSASDALKVKAWKALDMISRGKDPQKAYRFCRTSEQEVESFSHEWHCKTQSAAYA